MTETQINSKKKTKDFFSFLVFLLVLCLTFYVISQLFIPSVKEDCIYTVERGTSFKQISRSLEDEGLIPSGLSLETYAQLMGKDSQIKAGSFALKKGQSPVQILNSLVYDKPVLARVTIPEGFTADQVKTRVQRDLPSVEPLLDIIKQSKLPEPIKAEFLASPPPSPEGYLFPDTYYYSKTKPEEIYNAMYHQLVLTLEDLFLDYPDNPITNGTLTLHQAIILASVVEKEALLDEERSVIAGVFLKRLKG
ncbi:MAG: endolytic transglycosylase MltG, partial [Bacillota bacterium]